MSESKIKRQHAVDALAVAEGILALYGDEESQVQCRLAFKEVHIGCYEAALDRLAKVRTENMDARYQIETARLCLESLLRMSEVAA